MNKAFETLSKINNTYWLDKESSVVYSIFQYNSALWTNSNYAYQIVVRAFTVGYSFPADTIDQIGYIDVEGLIHYGAGRIGQIEDNGDKIQWIMGQYNSWSKVKQIPEYVPDSFRQASIQYMDNVNTAYIEKKYDETYNKYDNYYQGF
jgi:hypothetical protein